MKVNFEKYKNNITFSILLFINILNTHAANKQFDLLNTLKYEQSPYLLQHKDNPVNWMAWNDKTLNKALKQNKLIFLSIGYSTCHWCHVMEEQSFEDNDVAKVLNKNYISIKVDREEMPQVDSYYQHIYQIMNGRGGGWPLTIVMTPDKRVFYSATYIPKDNLIKILNDLDEVFKTDKNRVLKVALEIENILNNSDKQTNKNVDLKLYKIIDIFTSHLEQSYDENSGGFGNAPKFPRATTIEAMLDLYSINADKKLLDMVTYSLKAMAKGGIYDQIEGGFYRYSVDEKWLIPHFEKMLYTQAELLKVYSKAYLITKDELFKNIVDEIILFVDKRFKKNNLLFSASDADSIALNGKKEEGYYFVFDYDDTYKFLKRNNYNLQEIYDILKFFNITKRGNFEDNLNNPYLKDSKTLKNISTIKQDLEKLRSLKQYPFIDNKIQTSWNALYISSLFTASKIDTKYGDEAIKMLDRLVESMYINNTLYHQKLFDKPLKVKALLEDYSFLISSLIEAYQFNFDKRYLSLAKQLTSQAIKKFYINDKWYLSDDEFKSVSSIYDSAYRSSLSNMLENLFKLSILTDIREFHNLAMHSLKQNSYKINNNPSGVATAFNIFVGSQKQYKVLKSTKDNLVKNKVKIEKLNNPYLVIKAVNDKQYLACTINSCFSFDMDIYKVLTNIGKY